MPQQRINATALAAMLLEGKLKHPKPAKPGGSSKRRPDPDGGKDFDSGDEAKHAIRLKLEQRAGLIVSWERQVRLAIEPEGVRLCVYVADFVVKLPDGRFRIDECKGVWTDYAILKAKAFRLYWLPKHPDYEYRVLGGARRQAPRRGKR